MFSDLEWSLQIIMYIFEGYRSLIMYMANFHEKTIQRLFSWNKFVNQYVHEINETSSK